MYRFNNFPYFTFFYHGKLKKTHEEWFFKIFKVLNKHYILFSEIWLRIKEL